MKNPSLRAVAALVLALPMLALGCSKEAQAKVMLEKYEAVFRVCKEETEKAKLSPGEQRCSLVASIAVDLGLEESGLEEPKRRELLAAWLKEKGFVAHYLPHSMRPKEER
ncbi:hypothetical protein [Polyangium sorediatum]|uniref:Lipoprotein n=1 Tax=Polyangium sorediatum TaxID=889274 RepID=A0ABT6NUJ0_9BACT|nr:hypothetical protein [Polyangium sorediatum]MDI1431956.1 hypothetical protein [Polyangium sorediatum]